MSKLKIYLDNCCYNRPYDDQTQLKINLESLAKIEIQNMIRTKLFYLVTSYILITENAANPFKSKREDIKKFIDRYTHIYVSDKMDAEVKSLATQIMQSGVKLMDACHVASAIVANSDYFLTTDKQLLKYSTDSIRIMNPVDFIYEVEDQLL